LTKTPPKSPDQILLEVLERALINSTETRLIALGKKPDGAGLFATDKGANKTVIERCLGLQGDSLLQIVRTEEVSVGKKTQVHSFATITPGGVDHLFSKLPVERRASVAVAALDAASKSIAVLEHLIDSIVKRRDELLSVVESLVQRFSSSLEAMQDSAAQLAVRRDRIKTQLAKEPLPATSLNATPERAPMRRPDTDAEVSFRQRAAQELVFAWQESAREARVPIEAALHNIGAEPIGEYGDKTKFVGRLHESRSPVFQDDSVEVERPGWILRDDAGGYLLTHALVKPYLP